MRNAQEEFNTPDTDTTRDRDNQPEDISDRSRTEDSGMGEKGGESNWSEDDYGSYSDRQNSEEIDIHDSQI